MARELFGTDGIRGIAGEYPLDHKTVSLVGAALGKWVHESGKEHAVVIGMDTRESGPWIAAEVAGGLARYDVTTKFAGITTTPGVAFLAKNGPFAAGVMISASHNPYRDNGIKVIDHSGYKLADEVEERLEAEILAAQSSEVRAAALTVDEGLDRSYIEHLASTVSHRLDGLFIVADCANGGASHLAPALLERLGARVHPIGALPDGHNINLNCGSLHLDLLQSKVLELKADLGIAFDGDADRALFVSRTGKIVDGDAVMLVCARELNSIGKLTDAEGHRTVVATVMSNLGLEKALEKYGVRLVRTPVGDKYVLEEMLRIGAHLGGEQSGHVIFRDWATTGDGMLTALRVLDVICKNGAGLDELTEELKVYPQLLVNVRVKRKLALDDMPSVKAEIRKAEDSFGNSGRVLVRFSGTEPLARVMVEGPDIERVESFAHSIASQIRTELG